METSSNRVLNTEFVSHLLQKQRKNLTALLKESFTVFHFKHEDHFPMSALWANARVLFVTVAAVTMSNSSFCPSFITFGVCSQTHFPFISSYRCVLPEKKNVQKFVLPSNRLYISQVISLRQNCSFSTQGLIFTCCT